MAKWNIYSWSSMDSEDENRLSRFRAFVNKENFRKLIQDNGVQGVHTFLKNVLESSNKEQLHVAIAGQTGVGKSSLINALIGVQNKDKNASKVDVVQCTKEVRKFPFPRNDRVILYDIPGIGTKEFPRKDETLDKIDVKTKNVVIIVCASRFHENDIWLANKCRDMDKEVFYVRTKIDFDIYNEKADCEGEFNEERCLDRIKTDMKENIREGHNKNENFPIFLVSSRHRQKYDLNDLLEKLTKVFNTVGSDICQVIMKDFKDITNLKEEELNSGFFGRKIWATVCGFLPFPGLETHSTPRSVLHMQGECSKSMGITEEFIDQLSIDLKRDKNELKKKLKSFGRQSLDNCTREYIDHENKHLGTFGKYAKFYVPVIGLFLSAKKEYLTTCSCLQTVARNTKEDAETLVRMMLDKLQQDLTLTLPKAT